MRWLARSTNASAEGTYRSTGRQEATGGRPSGQTSWRRSTARPARGMFCARAVDQVQCREAILAPRFRHVGQRAGTEPRPCGSQIRPAEEAQRWERQAPAWHIAEPKVPRCRRSPQGGSVAIPGSPGGRGREFRFVADAGVRTRPTAHGTQSVGTQPWERRSPGTARLQPGIQPGVAEGGTLSQIPARGERDDPGRRPAQHRVSRQWSRT
jgi:hypothetical protein